MCLYTIYFKHILNLPLDEKCNRIIFCYLNTFYLFRFTSSAMLNDLDRLCKTIYDNQQSEFVEQKSRVPVSSPGL